jgi:hypothetical protein
MCRAEGLPRIFDQAKVVLVACPPFRVPAAHFLISLTALGDLICWMSRMGLPRSINRRASAGGKQLRKPGSY